MNTHKGDLSTEALTSEFQDGGWAVGVPRFFAVETVWAHAGLEALRGLRPDLVPEFNYARLLAMCNVRHPEYRSLSDEAAREVETLLGREVTPAIAREMRSEVWARRKYLFRRMMIPTAANGRRYFGELPTVADASRRYEEYARSEGISFDSISQHLS